MLDLVFQNSTADKKFKKDFFEKIIGAGVGELKMEGKYVETSVNLVGDSEIKELNGKYRRKNKVTDVLSFPLNEKSEIENWKLKIPKSNARVFDLGDIFICLPFAKKQAKSENVSIDSKLAQLTVHGFLHLAGYDHEGSASGAKKMFNLESHILKKLRFP